MPKTTLNWNRPTRRPRYLAGASSAMYMGPSTEEPPMPRPPIKRKKTSADQFQANAQPRAETRYKIGQDAQAVAASEVVAGDPGEHRAENRAEDAR